MGLYDTLEDTQVKLFFTPNLSVSYDYLTGKENVLQCNVIGGELRYYRRGSVLPVKTSYYDYGKNFIIFDYKGESTKDVKVQIVHNGIFVRNVDYRKIPLRYKIGLVVDKYGMPLRVKTLEDFKCLKEDYEKYSKEYFSELETDPILNSFYTKMNTVREYQKVPVVEQLNISDKNLISLSDFEKWDNEIYKPHLANLINRTMNCFREKWEYSESSDCYKEIYMGNMIGSYMTTLLRYDILEDNLSYCVLIGRLPCSILYYTVTKAFVEYFNVRNESINDLIDTYCDWCARHQIEGYSRKDIMYNLNKYSKELPEELKNLQIEYTKRREERASINR